MQISEAEIELTDGIRGSGVRFGDGLRVVWDQERGGWENEKGGGFLMSAEMIEGERGQEGNGGWFPLVSTRCVCA